MSTIRELKAQMEGEGLLDALAIAKEIIARLEVGEREEGPSYPEMIARHEAQAKDDADVIARHEAAAEAQAKHDAEVKAAAVRPTVVPAPSTEGKVV